MGLVVGSGNIYDDAICAFHDVLAPHTVSAQRVWLYLGLSGDIELHPLGK